MAGSASILSLGATVVLLFMLSYAVYLLLRMFESEEPPAPAPALPRERDIVVKPAPSPRQPGPPAAITVLPHTGKRDYFAGNAEALEAHQALIDRGGLERIGDFVIAEMPGYVLRAFTHPERNLLGIIYRDPSGKAWLNLQTEYADGRLITTSSMEKAGAPGSRPHGMPIFNYPAVSPEQLLRRHKLETRGVEQAPPLAPENFAAKFSANYARLQERAGAAPAESRVNAEELNAAGGEPETQTAPMEVSEETQPETVSEPQPGPEEFSPSLDQMRRWLELIYARLGVPRDQREAFRRGLVWIYEGASPESVISAVSEYSGLAIEPIPEGRLVIRTSAGAEDIVDAEGLIGSALFERINAHLPDGSKFTRLPVDAGKVAFFSRMAPNFAQGARPRE